MLKKYQSFGRNFEFILSISASHFLELFILKFVEAIAVQPEDKSLENMCVFLAELYNFRVSIYVTYSTFSCVVSNSPA